MNIICDICGSEYPETEERCPTCNYPRQGNEKTAAVAAAAAQTKVKGGRFSNKNVKKRRKQQLKAARETVKDPNRPLIIAIVLLLIAIALVSAYIALRFWRGRGDDPRTTVPTTTAPVATTTEPAPALIPCTGLELGLESPVLELVNVGEQMQLAVQVQPADSTDAVVFQSADPAVATVTETGLVTAVGSGQTTITVTCGAVTEEISVFCWIDAVPTETAPVPTEPAPTEPVATEPKPTEPKQTEPKPTEAPVLKLDPADASCFTAGETFVIYPRLGSSTVSRSKVTWTTSDPKVATVENGTVTAVGKGEAVITAVYEDQKATCTVRCRFENPAPTEPTKGQEDQENQEDQGNASASDWKVRPNSDVSITIGESFRLKVVNGAGETADVIWTMDKEGVISIEGNKVTGRAPGEVLLNTQIDGVSLSCIVRVR